MNIIDIRKNKPEWATHYYMSNGFVIYTTPSLETESLLNSDNYEPDINSVINQKIEKLKGTHETYHKEIIILDGEIAKSANEDNCKEIPIMTTVFSFKVKLCGDFRLSIEKYQKLSRELKANEEKFKDEEEAFNFLTSL